jgi:hypothetical protein
MVLVGTACVPPDDVGGDVVVVPDELAAFDPAVFGMGGGRVISGSTFLFLNNMHNANQQH